MLTYEQQLELKERLNDQGIPLDFTISSPYAEVVEALLAKIEGGQPNVSTTATVTAGTTVTAAETTIPSTATTDTTTAGDGSITAGPTAPTDN